MLLGFKSKTSRKDNKQYFIQDSMNVTFRLELKTFFFFVQVIDFVRS